MSSLTFRTANPADAERIGALVRAAYRRWIPIVGREPRPMLVDYAEALTRHRFDLLEQGPTLVGLIETDLRDDHLWIENVAVAPEWQGQGYGLVLLRHAESLANAAGRQQLRLLTNGKMDANRRLYAAVGYAETLEDSFMDGTIVYMQKDLWQ